MTWKFQQEPINNQPKQLPITYKYKRTNKTILEQFTNNQNQLQERVSLEIGKHLFKSAL